MRRIKRQTKINTLMLLALFLIISIMGVVIISSMFKYDEKTYTERLYDYTIISSKVDDSDWPETVKFILEYEVNGVDYTGKVFSYIHNESDSELLDDYLNNSSEYAAKQLIGNVFYNPDNPAKINNTRREDFTAFE